MIRNFLLKSFSRGKNSKSGKGLFLDKDWFKDSIPKPTSNQPSRSSPKSEFQNPKQNQKRKGDFYSQFLNSEEIFNNDFVKSKYTEFNVNKVYDDAKPLYLDDLNTVGIENEKTFHKIPRLAYCLEEIM